MGVYWAAPLLGPSLGPIIGGILAQAFSWRAIFYFLAIFGAVSLLSFVLFKDTFRRERSLAYQEALRQATKGRRTSSDDVATLTTNVSGEKGDLDRVTPDPEGQPQPPVKIGLRHIQIIGPILLVLRRINNICVLTASGILCSFTCMKHSHNYNFRTNFRRYLILPCLHNSANTRSTTVQL
jgi:MFS family permease